MLTPFHLILIPTSLRPYGIYTISKSFGELNASAAPMFSLDIIAKM